MNEDRPIMPATSQSHWYGLSSFV